MKVFCTKCGNALEVEPAAARAVLTCPKCGHQFSAQPMGQAASSGGKSVWFILLIVLGVGAIPCIGILAAIAVPNFIKFQARSKQAECKANLKALYIAEKSYFAEKDTYSPQVATVGFSPERGNRFAYFVAEGPMQERGAAPNEAATAVAVDVARYPSGAVRASDLPPEFAGVRLGVIGKCPDCQVTVACAGNVDNDPELDVWSISSVERTAADGERIPAGQAYHDQDDLTR
jgi:type II secretory pathway pseudopilin PulG